MPPSFYYLIYSISGYLVQSGDINSPICIHSATICQFFVTLLIIPDKVIDSQPFAVVN